jgi:integrase/recombinase XerC
MSTSGAGRFRQTWVAYRDWLGQQPLAANTQRAYLVQVRQYCAYLESLPFAYGDPLRQRHARDYAVRDYKLYLQTSGHAKPSSVNLALAALDHFHRFLGLGPAQVARSDLPIKCHGDFLQLADPL